jgi:hypothetical protein
LTATFLTGVPGQAPADATTPTPNPALQQALSSPASDAQPAQPVRLIDRIRNFFRGNQPDQATAAMAPTVTSGPASFGTAPTGPYSWQQGRMQPSPTQTVTTMRPSFAPERTDLDKAGHEKDYSWITGRLARDGGRWIIRYAGPNEVDRFGGRLLLFGNVDMSKMHEGDLVCVLGQPMNSGRVTPGAASAVVYQVREINLIERAR